MFGFFHPVNNTGLPQGESHIHNYSIPGWNTSHQVTSKELAGLQNTINSKHNQVKTVKKKKKKSTHLKIYISLIQSKNRKLWGKFSEIYSVQDQTIDQITGI